MLSRPHRLPATDIPTVMKRGRRIVVDGATFIYRETKNTVPHFSFIVSAKVDKRATVRNRMKRLLSESVRRLLPQITKSIDGVIIGGKQFIGLTQVEAEKLVVELLKKAKILNNE